MTPALAHVTTWIFDLDNTLYPPESRLEDEVVNRMVCYTAGRFNLGIQASKDMVYQHHVKHGATVIGYYEDHGVEPEHFLTFAYWDVPLEKLNEWRDSAELAEVRSRIAALPGRKLVFTNGTRYHAERVLSYLGMRELFDDIIDIADGDYRPKPQMPMYTSLMRRYGVDPKRSAFVEDSAKNLTTAKELGMYTVLVNRPGTPTDQTVDASAPSLLDWLRQAA
ncbi:MAG: pyrimidine 5'-nucleotidase [Proteobacteria bacterium]|nr:pyrimidine 5'-nucleotidase [Pseudomonadota bacterium]